MNAICMRDILCFFRMQDFGSSLKGRKLFIRVLLYRRIWYAMMMHFASCGLRCVPYLVYCFYSHLSPTWQVLSTIITLLSGGKTLEYAAIVTCSSTITKILFEYAARNTQDHRELEMMSNLLILLFVFMYSAFLLVIASWSPWFVMSKLWKWIRKTGAKSSVTGTTKKVEEYDKYDPLSAENAAERESRVQDCHSLVAPYIKQACFQALGGVLFDIIYQHDSDPNGMFVPMLYILIPCLHFVGEFQPKS